MQKINICPQHANQAGSDVRQKYGANFPGEIIINVVSDEGSCWYCKQGVPINES